MIFQDRKGVVCGVGVAAMLAAVIALAGCQSHELRRSGNLPGDLQLIGGGLNVTWKAPVAGTVYLIEKKTGKLIETHSLGQGESYSFKVESVVQAQELQDMLGVHFSKLEFLL
jgi:hypothetical protein